MKKKITYFDLAPIKEKLTLAESYLSECITTLSVETRPNSDARKGLSTVRRLCVVVAEMCQEVEEAEE